MIWKFAVIVILFASVFQLYILSQTLPAESYYTIEEYCESKGYKAVEHKVLTEDGYILSAFRIYKQNPKGKPVLMLHGFNGAAEFFLINVHTKSSAFKLVDAEYDVWLLNARGNFYTQNHVSLSPKDKEFWD